MGCRRLEFYDSLRMEVWVKIHQFRVSVMGFSRQHKNSRNWYYTWEVIWIIRLVKISRVVFIISAIRRSLSLDGNRTLVLISAGNRRFMLYEVDGPGIHQI